jgi:hypothetical protein
MCISRRGSCLSNILELLIENIGRKFVTVCLQIALEDISTHDSKVSPAVGHLALVHICNQIIQAFQLHVQSCELHILACSATIHRNMVLSKNDFISSLESQLNQLVQKRVTGKKT